MKENCLIFWNPIPVDEQELLLEMTMGNRIRIAVIGADKRELIREWLNKGQLKCIDIEG